MDKNKNPFEDFEVISSYSDQEAIDDGIIVDIAPLGVDLCVQHGLNRGPVNRMTSNLFNRVFSELVEEGADDMLDIMVSMLTDWVNRIGELVQVDEPSLLKSYVVLSSGTKGDGTNYHEKIWFIQNEVGGYTAMLPEDY